MDTMRARVRGKGLRIAYPEGTEERAVRAAALLRDHGLVHPVLIGARDAIEARARAAGVALDGIEVRDPVRDDALAQYAGAYHELRRHKGVSEEAARERARLPHYFAALMVRAGAADGFVSGLNSETKPFIPAFEVVGMAP